MKKALYPGSFDPITLGHVDIIERSARAFDELVLLVSKAFSKNYLFSPNERLELIQESVSHIKNVSVDLYDGLTVNYAKKNKIPFIVRGVRSLSDFESEFSMANMNKDLYSEIETCIFFSSPQYIHISSKLVKEISTAGGDLTSFLPVHIIEALKSKKDSHETL